MKNPSKPAAFVSSLLIFVLVFSYLTSTTAEHEEVGNAEKTYVYIDR